MEKIIGEKTNRQPGPVICGARRCLSFLGPHAEPD